MEVTHSTVILSLLMGLIGCVTPNLRAVRVEYSSKHIFLFFYYDNPPSEQEEELAEDVATQVMAGFPDIALTCFETKKITLPYPNLIPKIGTPVYLRYEPSIEES